MAQLLTTRVIERRGVEEPLAGILGVPDQDRGAPIGCRFRPGRSLARRRDPHQRGLDLLAEPPMEEQVLRGIPREREFGCDQKIGTGGARRLSGSDHTGRIACDIADQQV